MANSPPDLAKVAIEIGTHQGFNLELDASDVLAIVAHLQLALRHPANQTGSTDAVRSFIEAVIQIGFDYCPETQKLLIMGMSAENDMTAHEFATLISPK